MKRTSALASCNVVVWMARTVMEGTYRQPNPSREFVQLLDAIRHEVEPCMTVLQDPSVVYVNHWLFSLLGGNLALGEVSAMAPFQWQR